MIERTVESGNLKDLAIDAANNPLSNDFIMLILFIFPNKYNKVVTLYPTSGSNWAKKVLQNTQLCNSKSQAYIVNVI